MKNISNQNNIIMSIWDLLSGSIWEDSPTFIIHNSLDEILQLYIWNSICDGLRQELHFSLCNSIRRCVLNSLVNNKNYEKYI